METVLTDRQRLAATRLARGDMTQEAVCRELGITGQTLVKWKKHPDFQQVLDDEAERIRQAIRAEGIANRQNRIDAINRRHDLMEQVIAARAAANLQRAELLTSEGRLTFEGYAAAGAATGLMVHTVTYLKDGRREEWAVDTGLLKELREHEKQAAQDLGQWTEKKEVTGKGGLPLMPEPEPFDYDGYARAFALIAAGTGAPLSGPDGDPEPLDSPAADG